MAARSGIFFSANVSIQMEAAARFAFTFSSFPKAIVPRNPPTGPSITESGNSTIVKSNLTAQSSITRRVSELDINKPPIVRPRATRRPVISNTDLISGIDRVTKSLAECIQLGESVLGHSCDPAVLTYGLHNNSSVYSDQIRVRMGNLRIKELDQSDSE
jgi:hypothetical protein